MRIEESKAPTAAPAVEAARKRGPQDMNRVLTRTSWLPYHELRLSDWVEHGRALGIIGRGVGWWIGDWLRYGNMKFGERYVRAQRITGYDVQTLMNMVYVATAYEPEQRRSSLSWSHHAELAALPPDDRERWLDLAESNRHSVRCLREELRRERRLVAVEAAPELTAPVEVEADAGAPGDVYELHCPQCGCRIAEPLQAPVPLPARRARGQLAAAGGAA